MFVWLYKLLGKMLAFFSSITGSYALALLFYALIFKIVFLPFSIKQQKNQIAMAKLTPKIELIRAKYRGRTDQPSMQKQQQEIMDLQQKEGYSPLSGCLPLLIQLPLIMLLYAVIQNPLSYIARTNSQINDYNANKEAVTEVISNKYADKVAEGKDITMSDVILSLYREYKDSSATEVPQNYEINLIGDITRFVNNDEDPEGRTREQRIEAVEALGIDYESIPNFTTFGVNLADTPNLKNFSILVLIPILAAVSSWLSMWLTRKMNNTGMQSAQDAQTQASMKIMDLVMPLMTLFIAFNFSGMLGLYWIYQSLLGILQSFILAKVMPLPKFTEEELKEMRRAQKEAEKAQRAAAKLQPKYKSLHYIDEDDYDELPTLNNNDGASKKTNMSSDIPEIKD